MGKIILILLTAFAVGFAHAHENTVWERYVQPGNIEYKNFEEIDFKEASQDALNLPGSLYKSVNNLTKFSSEQKDLEDQFDARMLEEIQKREILDLELLQKLTIKQILELAIDITQRSMFYQYDRYTLRTEHKIKIDSVQCFLDGCGVCEDYARTLARVFYWLKPYNPKLKNVFILYTVADTFEPASADKANKVLKDGAPILHAWNILAYFTEQKMVYSHIDTTGSEWKYGQMREGQVGYHLSENANVNFAQLLYSLREYRPSLELMFNEYGRRKKLYNLPVVERIRMLNRLVTLADQSGEYDLSCKYYKQLLKLVPESTKFEASVRSCCGSEKEARR